MADTSSVNALSGISSGIDTSALINAIVGMKSGNLTRLKAKQDLNQKKATALNDLRTSLSGLTLSLATLVDKFNNRTVASSDSNNTNVTATASGAASGNYDLTVKTVATKGRLSSVLDTNGWATNLAVASPTDSVNSNIFTPGAPATFAIQGTDGVIKTFTLDDSSNTLNGLRDRINASGAGVTAAVLNTGKGDKPYQLVVTAKATGTGSTGGVVTLVDITNQQADGSAGAAANTLGITAGTVNSLTTPTVLTNGLTSTNSGAVATDATFTLNGVALTRQSNVVSDVAEGMVFTLKQGGQAGVTTLTVTPDKIGATATIQDFITKYNQLVKDYKTASTATKNDDGSINEAPLSGDVPTRTLMANLKSTLLGTSAGMPSDASYKTLASIGITSLADGGLFLNTATFQSAVATDLPDVQRLFSFTGESTNSVATFKSAGPKTVTGSVDFAVTRDQNGALWGTFTRNGVTSDPVQAVDGLIQGAGDFAGLNIAVTSPGSGTLTLSRGAGRAASDLLSGFTGSTGSITNMLNTISTQNKGLATQISLAQARLDREKEQLRKKFADMEATVGRMKSAAGSLAAL